MSSSDDLKQHVNRELETFHRDAQKALETFDEFEKIVSEINDIKQAYEANLKDASERAKGLDHYIENAKTKLFLLERDMVATLDRLKNIEAECCQQMVKIQEEMNKLQEGLQDLHSSVNDKIDQNMGALQEMIEQRFSGIDENLKNQAINHSKEIQSLDSKLNSVQHTLISDLESSRNEYRESFTKIDQNMGALQEMIEQRFSKIIDQRLNSLESMITRQHKCLIRMAVGIGLILIGLVGEIVIPLVLR